MTALLIYFHRTQEVVSQLTLLQPVKQEVEYLRQRNSKFSKEFFELQEKCKK